MSEKIVAIVGLGYVGLPLAVTFGKIMKTIGFDIKQEAIANYQRGVDLNGEVDASGFLAAKYLTFTSDPKEIGIADYIIVVIQLQRVLSRPQHGTLIHYGNIT